MASSLPTLADAQNKFEDLSGVNIAAYANPYDALIEATHGDPVSIITIFIPVKEIKSTQNSDCDSIEIAPM